jgi:hypothetical protein
MCLNSMCDNSNKMHYKQTNIQKLEFQYKDHNGSIIHKLSKIQSIYCYNEMNEMSFLEYL